MPDDSRSKGQHSSTTLAIYSNSARSLDPWVRSTGFRTHGLRHRSLSFSNDPRLAEDFLLNSRLVRHDLETMLSVQSYFYDAGQVMISMVGREDKSGQSVVPLPPGVRLRRELGDVLGQRRSRRAYTGDPMPLDYLATIVRAAGAVTGQATVGLLDGGETTMHFRTAPSGGGLYPVDVYLAALRVTGLDRRVYRYDPLDDTLVVSGEPGDVDRLLSAIDVPEELITVKQSDVIFLLVGHSWRSMRKYGTRGTRFLFLEAGAIAQNINLATEALGFGSVDCASVYDDEVHETLHIDGLYQTLLHAVIAGYPG